MGTYPKFYYEEHAQLRFSSWSTFVFEGYISESFIFPSIYQHSFCPQKSLLSNILYQYEKNKLHQDRLPLQSTKTWLSHLPPNSGTRILTSKEFSPKHLIVKKEKHTKQVLKHPTPRIFFLFIFIFAGRTRNTNPSTNWSYIKIK